MARVLGGFGGTQVQAAIAIALVPSIPVAGIGTARIELPTQLQRQHPVLAGAQPQLQLRQQTARAKQHGGGRFDLRGQFQRRIKHLGQAQPGIGLGRGAISLVQSRQQGRAKAAGYAAARHGTQMAPGSTAQTLQRGQMRLRCSQRVEGQSIGW